MSRLRAILFVLIATGCAQPYVAWDGERHEDPAPTGPAYLRAYKEAHYRSLGREFVDALDWQQFLHELEGKQVLFLGDHHEDEALHDRMLATIIGIARSGRRIAIGLEAIGVQDEIHVARYLRGDCDLDGLRDAMRDRWSNSWLDLGSIDAGFYRALLEIAREAIVPVFALEPTPRLTLPLRDEVMANRIRQVHRDMHDRLLVVIVGHAHLLGKGQLVRRVGLEPLAVAARMSQSLRRCYPQREMRSGRFLRSDSGVLFFQPPPDLR